MCGENSLSEVGDIFEQGSPPRVRGKPRLSRDARADHGITPACAGKTALMDINAYDA